jgi:hypothetical protein
MLKQNNKNILHGVCRAILEANPLLPSDPFVIRLLTLIITLADLYEGVTSIAYSAFPHEQISSSPPPLPEGKGVQQKAFCRPLEVRSTRS